MKIQMNDTNVDSKGAKSANTTTNDFDAIVVGAGVAGLYQLYLLRKMGLKVRSFEAGSAIGGT